jgi:hypothetical protein
MSHPPVPTQWKKIGFLISSTHALSAYIRHIVCADLFVVISGFVDSTMVKDVLSWLTCMISTRTGEADHWLFATITSFISFLLCLSGEGFFS